MVGTISSARASDSRANLGRIAMSHISGRAGWWKPPSPVLVRASGEQSPGATRHSKLTVNDPNPEANHRPLLYDSGRPSSVIWVRTVHATTGSATRPPRDRARRRSPRIDVYRKHAVSTRAWRWEPASFFQRRRPSGLTSVIVRSRARARGRRRDTLAVVDGGPTTVASRSPAASSNATVSSAASAVTRAIASSTVSLRSLPMVAASTVGSVSA